ncbi:hypothetical protein HK100_011080 [Physocladia obscura]|uniref:E3 ubiquitin ligase complex SCF subunit n=1 Tax=Physocladia obscura TaxID=109957 RepID=A0AAD5T3M9_9FUNG|nr:hypothetical protein HK100_011080 [Physocladia obscura]
MVKLTSSDLVEFNVERTVAERSVLLKNMLEVLEYCERHKNDALPATDSALEVDDFGAAAQKKSGSDDIDEWDSAFIKVDNDLLFEIILAANYLDIKALLDLGCKTVANMIKGKSAEQIRDMFNIENDFTPEEEEQIRRENEWAADLQQQVEIDRKLL